MINLPFVVRVYNLTYRGEIPMGLDNNFIHKKKFSTDELTNAKIIERKLTRERSEYFIILRNKTFFILNEKEKGIFVEVLRSDNADFDEVEATC